MPLWLRKFTFQQISDIKKQEAEEKADREKQQRANVQRRAAAASAEENPFQESNQIDFSFDGIELTPSKISPDASRESFSSLPIAPTISSLDADQQHSIHDLW